MGTTTNVKTTPKTEPKARVRKARKATFTVEIIDNVRTFTPVNKRAKMFATVLNETKLKVADLKAIRKAGIRPYTNIDGKLKAIAL